MSDYYFVGADIDVCNRVIFAADEVASRFVDTIDSVTVPWTGGEVELVDDPDEERLAGCEVLSLFRCLLVLNDRVRLAWGERLDQLSLEWIPARYQASRWWILRSKVMLDAICESRSTLTRARSGRVMVIGELVVDAGACLGHEFFRLNGGLECWQQVVTSAVRESWLNSGFRGLSFTPIKT